MVLQYNYTDSLNKQLLVHLAPIRWSLLKTEQSNQACVLAKAEFPRV
jgi:hypothetical protein